MTQTQSAEVGKQETVGSGANARQAYDLALAGAIGAVIGLYLDTELAQSSEALRQSNALWWARDLLAGITLGGTIGFTLNALEPLRAGALRKFARLASRGALAGAIGGGVGLIVGELTLDFLKGGLVGRAVSWAILGLGIGLSQGIAHRSRQRLGFGLLGGGLGGFVGGFLFELFREGFGSSYDPTVSQGLGIAVLGAGLGLCLALVEQVLRRAWVQVLQGRQEGRIYLLTGGSNRLGLDEQAEVGLFGDPEISRRHAEIEATRDGYRLLNHDARGRTRLNGQPVSGPTLLHDGDRIELGHTLILFRHRAVPHRAGG